MSQSALPPELHEFVEAMAELLAADYLKRSRAAPPDAETPAVGDPEEPK